MPDIYANIASIQVVESAANTITFKKLETGVALFEKVAWLIHRIEYFPEQFNISQFADTGDYVDMALTVVNNLASLSDLSDPAVLSMDRLLYFELGTPANAWFEHLPIVREFTNIPGGGLIVPPNPLYLGVKGSGCAAANVVDVRIYYTVKELKAEEFWELVESRRIISS